MTNIETAQAELIAVYKCLFSTRNPEAQRYGLECLQRVSALEHGKSEPHKLTKEDLSAALALAYAWSKETGRAA